MAKVGTSVIKYERVQLIPGASQSQEIIKIGTPPVTREKVASIEDQGLTSLTRPEDSLKNNPLLLSIKSQIYDPLSTLKIYYALVIKTF
jgi:hypothetical protein